MRMAEERAAARAQLQHNNESQMINPGISA